MDPPSQSAAFMHARGDATPLDDPELAPDDPPPGEPDDDPPPSLPLVGPDDELPHAATTAKDRDARAVRTAVRTRDVRPRKRMFVKLLFVGSTLLAAAQGAPSS
jgi:hypothetical protein